MHRVRRLLGLPEGSGMLFDRGSRVRLTLAVLGSLFTAGLDMLGVAALVPLIQLLSGAPKDSGALGAIRELLGGDPADQTVAIAISVTIIGAFVFKGLATLAFRWWQLGFLSRLEAHTSIRLLRGFLAAPYLLHLRRGASEFFTTLGDAVNRTYGQVVAGLVGAITDALTVLLLVILLVVTSPIPAMVAIAYFCVVGGLLVRWTRPRALAAGQRMMVKAMEATRVLFGIFGGTKEIYLRHNGELFVERFAATQMDLVNLRRKVHFMGEFPKYLLEIIFIVGIGIMAVTSYAASSPTDALAVLGVFVAAGTRILPSAARLVAASVQIKAGRSGIDRVIADLREAGPTTELGRGEKVPGPDGDLALDEVSFSYPTSQAPVLDRVSLTVPRGSSLAVVGPSGSGKTTLTDLIMGLHSPSSGSIRVGGTDIQDSLRGWQTQIGLVPQDVYLLDDSLRANIAFGSPDEIDRERVAECVRAAQLEDLVAALPHGLDTQVGERGSRLSGGQRQRVGIARALYTDPRLIVLDEATSALDNDTERRLTETIEALSGQVTRIVVAHRLSTVRNCDQLVFLRAGRVESRGTFDEVARDNPHFARLVRLGSLHPGGATVDDLDGDI